MVRPRWQDAVIALWLTALFAGGVAAIWGDDIAGWFEDEEKAPPSRPVAPTPGIAYSTPLAPPLP